LNPKLALLTVRELQFGIAETCGSSADYAWDTRACAS
jgi:hypothetical protein